ncbi:MAG: PH domain-containing protein [Gammaproteobacteria bacterium]|nr:PH domain-containing protein [Gammaproteobacteria bacterium]
MNNPEWHRISFLSVIHFFISRGINIIKEVGFNSAPIIVAGVVAIDDTAFWFSIFGLVLLAILLLDALIIYWTFKFQITHDQIIVKQGYFTKEVLNLKYDRIQNVNISEPWYFKPFKLVNCMLDSAGSNTKEASIPGITKESADRVSQQVLNYQLSKNVINDNENSEYSEDKSTVQILKLSNVEVTKYGFTNSMIFVVAAATFPVIEKTIERAGWDFTVFLNEVAAFLPLPELPARIIIFILSFILFGLLLLSFTAIGSFIRFHNFELHNESSKLKRIAGLLDRQQITVRKQKVQGISIKQNIFAKLLNRVTLQFHQTQSDRALNSKKQHLIIPMLKSEQWQQYVSWVFTDFSSTDIKFQKINRQYLIRRSLMVVIFPVVLLTTFLVITTTIHALIILGVIPFGIAVFWQRYRRYGYYINENYSVIRSGFIGVRYTIFPLYKLQKLNETTTTGQRRWQLGSGEFQLAFGKVHLPYIPISIINKIFNLTLYKVESSTKNWL